MFDDEDAAEGFEECAGNAKLCEGSRGCREGLRVHVVKLLVNLPWHTNLAGRGDRTEIQRTEVDPFLEEVLRQLLAARHVLRPGG